MLQYRRWFPALVALLLAVLCAAPASAATPEDYDRNLPQLLVADNLYADAAILMDGDTGDVLFSKNAEERMYPASTTKIMTLMLALESGISLETPIIIPQQASQIPSDSTLVPVFPGDQMRFGDLLYGFMLSSGNDGANAVAVLVGGSLETFVNRMNERAAQLGCTGTHFANAHGYHEDDHYTTARDLAVITRAAIANPTFRDIVSCTRYDMTILRDGETIHPWRGTSNALLNKESSYYYTGCFGVKTGTHSRAGNCFVGAAERDGVRLVSVVLRCAQSNQKWVDTIRLFNYGYTRYTAYTLDQMFAYTKDQIATVKISNAISTDPNGGTLDLNVAQISNPDYTRMVANGNEEAFESAIADFVTRSMLTITHSMVAPISEGEVMGQFRYVAQSGEEITALLVAGRSVEAEPPRFTIEDFFPFIRQLQDVRVRALIIVIVCLILMLILAAIIHRVSQQRKRTRIYEVRKLEALRTEREIGRRARARQRRTRRRARFDDYLDADDRYEDDDDYDEYDDYDDDGYDDTGVRRIPKKRR